ncbi:MAG: UDP-N-acetylglucosamine 2-epimerase (non-hydrolyzing) [Candidatus Eremiobacteraeota bacterium]|nr:UDP-N-acetylglucosamine 2-epimerase (non-hydrolyzing) [Candidatus Eremiobacteraeota bacterium]
MKLKKKVAIVFGTRPEAVKLAPVIIELKKHEDKIDTLVVVTAQHREMLDQVLNLFEIVPDRDLDIMEKNQTLTRITVKALEGLEKIFIEEKVDLVITQGDTTTSFVAALAAFYQKIAVGHVEAGLRTDNKYDPYPEEMNRRLITVLGDLNFAPTSLAVENLRKSGVSDDTIFLTGNTVIDALLHIANREDSVIPPEIRSKIIPGKRILLVEAHRRENLGKPMENICRALLSLVNDFPDTQLIFSVHRNPKVRDTVFPMLRDKERITLLEPVDYPVLLSLMKKSYLVLTDSGGIQEEGPSLGKPVLVMRKTTERPEGVDAGTAKLVGVETENIYKSASELLTDSAAYEKMAHTANPYGDGQASRRTAEAILYNFGFRDERPDEFGTKLFHSTVGGVS